MTTRLPGANRQRGPPPAAAEHLAGGLRMASRLPWGESSKACLGTAEDSAPPIPPSAHGLPGQVAWPGLPCLQTVNHPSTLPQAFEGCKIEVEGSKAILTLAGYDPDSVREAQLSTRPGKRKAPEVWNVSSSSASTSSLLQRAQCVPVCIAQGLLGAFDGLKAAIDEHKKPAPPRVLSGAAKLQKAVAPTAPTALPAVPAAAKAELAAKDKAIQGREKELQSKEDELKAVKAELAAKDSQISQAQADQLKNLNVMLEGAKAQGDCMHLHLHWCPTIHHTIICFLASRNRSFPSTGGRAPQLAPGNEEIHHRHPLEQRPRGG